MAMILFYMYHHQVYFDGNVTITVILTVGLTSESARR